MVLFEPGFWQLGALNLHFQTSFAEYKTSYTEVRGSTGTPAQLSSIGVFKPVWIPQETCNKALISCGGCLSNFG